MIRLKRAIALVALGLAGLVLAGCGSAEPPLAQTEPPVVTVSQPLEQDDHRLRPVHGPDRSRRDGRGAGPGARRADQDPLQGRRPRQGGGPAVRPRPADLPGGPGRGRGEEGQRRGQPEAGRTEYERTYELLRSKAAAARRWRCGSPRRAIALAEVGQAEAEIEQAKLDVDFTKIKAPITGRISRPQVTKGNLVNAGGGDTLLTTIVSVDPIYVYFDVDERSLQLLPASAGAKEVGDTPPRTKPPIIPVFLGLVADGDRLPARGRHRLRRQPARPATGTIRVRGVFPNKDGRLTPGQFARVRLPVGEKYKGLLVTDRAVGTDQGQKYVLVVNDKNMVEYRPVDARRARRRPARRPPGTGLKPGEWVIVNGIQRVRPGDRGRARARRHADPAGGARQGRGREASVTPAPPGTLTGSGGALHDFALLHRPADLRHGALDRDRDRRRASR